MMGQPVSDKGDRQIGASSISSDHMGKGRKKKAEPIPIPEPLSEGEASDDGLGGLFASILEKEPEDAVVEQKKETLVSCRKRIRCI